MELARSEYVKRRIAETPWERRNEIDDLLLLEKIALGEMDRAGWVWNGYVRPQIIKRLYRDYLAIQDELDPGWRERGRAKWEREKNENLAEFLTRLDSQAARRRADFEAKVRAWREAGHILEPEPTYEPALFEGWTLDAIIAWHVERAAGLPWEPTWHPEKLYG